MTVANFLPMPFRSEELRKRFAAGIERGRMGHTYLLTGDHAEALENLALGLAGQVLGSAPLEHPDFHAVRPESKSRHITVEQVRELERELYLRPFSAPLKVAVIFDAERTCLGGASAANAFLNNTNLTRVVIPASVTTIGSGRPPLAAAMSDLRTGSRLEMSASSRP